MKRICLVVVAALFLLVPFAVAKDGMADALEKDLNVTSCGKLNVGEILRARHLFDMGTSVLKLAEMQAVINVGLENDVSVSQLEAIMAEAKEKFDAIDVTDRESYRQSISEIRELISEFRETAHEIEGLDAFSEQIMEALHEARLEVEDEVKAWREQARVEASEVALAVFDLHVCIAEKRVEALERRDLNGTFTGEVNEKFDALKDLRTSLEAALLSGDREEVKLVDREIKDAWRDFRHIFLDALRDIVNDFKEKVKVRLGKIKDRFTKVGEDTAELDRDSGELILNLENMERHIGSDQVALANQSLKKSRELMQKMQGDLEVVKSRHMVKTKSNLELKEGDWEENNRVGLKTSAKV